MRAAARPPGVTRAILPAVALAAFAAGVWLFLPLIEEEHKRLETPLAFALWAGDGVAAFWCLQYIVKALCRGEPRRDEAVGARRARRQCLLVSATLGIGMVIDVAATAWTVLLEQRAFETAARVQGEIYAVEEKRFPENTRYRLHCRFRDGAGGLHTFVCTARHERGGEFVPPLDRQTQAAVRARALPHPVPVSYDPDWPDRSWLTAAGWRWDEFTYCYRFQGMSGVVLLHQAIAVPVFLLVLWGAGARGIVPWWYEYHKVVPLLTEGVALVLYGLIFRMNAA
jgi:hypothetical protein